MANELIHSNPGSVLTKAEYESITNHVANNQARGDVLISNTAGDGWIRLAKGTTGGLLAAGANDPEWNTKVLHTSNAFAFQESTTLSSTGTLTINAFSLGGKLTAGATEIEGSGFDIDGGTIDGVTITSPTINGTIATTGLTIPGFTMGGSLNTGGNSITGSAYTITSSSGNLTLSAAAALALSPANTIDFSKNFVAQADALQIIPWQTANTYLRLMAFDTGVGNVEVARMQGAADPYFAMGGSQEFKFYYSGTANFGDATIDSIKDLRGSNSQIIDFWATTSIGLNTWLKLFVTDTDGDGEGELWYDDSEKKLKFRTAAGVETITSA